MIKRKKTTEQTYPQNITQIKQYELNTKPEVNTDAPEG